MSRFPRILPLAGVAVAGVLAVNALAGADTIPRLFSGAKARAEGTTGKPDPGAAAAKAPTPVKPPAAVCAPTAAELAKEAGLSPAELRVLQSLGDRRGQLDEREQGMDVQLQLLAAAEAKLDAKFKSLNGLKGDIQNLLGQADAQQEQEIVRLVTVFSAMKAKDAAAQMRVLDDSVRLPIAAKMKERTLAAILAQMPPVEAKQITEQLARRYTANAAILAGKDALKPEVKTAEATPAQLLDPKGGSAGAGGTALAQAAEPARKAPVRKAAPKPAPKPVARKPVAQPPTAATPTPAPAPQAAAPAAAPAAKVG
jgi:flagellar motility protein MotE (MotC chaperone)